MRAGKQSTRWRTARQGGSVAVEMALVLPLLVLIVLLCVDFGRFAYTYIAAKNAARAGAEYGIMHPYSDSSKTTWENNIQEAARDEMEQQRGYTRTNLTTTVTVTIESSGLRRVRVKATYSSFRPIVHWPKFPATFDLKGEVEMRPIR